MAITTKILAVELGRSERQVVNYKKAVEVFLGVAITFRQGKQHFYPDEYAELVRMYARGEPLPQSPRHSVVDCPILGLLAGCRLWLREPPPRSSPPVEAMPNSN